MEIKLFGVLDTLVSKHNCKDTAARSWGMDLTNLWSVINLKDLHIQLKPFTRPTMYLRYSQTVSWKHIAYDYFSSVIGCMFLGYPGRSIDHPFPLFYELIVLRVTEALTFKSDILLFIVNIAMRNGRACSFSNMTFLIAY